MADVFISYKREEIAWAARGVGVSALARVKRRRIQIALPASISSPSRSSPVRATGRSTRVTSDLLARRFAHREGCGGEFREVWLPASGMVGAVRRHARGDQAGRGRQEAAAESQAGTERSEKFGLARSVRRLPAAALTDVITDRAERERGSEPAEPIAGSPAACAAEDGGGRLRRPHTHLSDAAAKGPRSGVCLRGA